MAYNTIHVYLKRTVCDSLIQLFWSSNDVMTTPKRRSILSIQLDYYLLI